MANNGCLVSILLRKHYQEELTKQPYDLETRTWQALPTSEPIIAANQKPRLETLTTFKGGLYWKDGILFSKCEKISKQ
ncbi:hypothetical protein RvY_02851 [Ramazzottius varieornatus]|uniref:Uncharacterized protein n=1 Tax=Ramazzottius varieornatus TaxID=947166 RepID=A0A1D1UL40_RAMVA|nr:hypothetical protein RvY_02851 [Ramazzottius varieornatus]